MRRTRRRGGFRGLMIAASITVLAAATTISIPSEGRNGTSGQRVASGASFNALSTGRLWSVIRDHDGRAVVGLKAPSAEVGVRDGIVVLAAREWERSKATLLATRGVRLIDADTHLPHVTVRIADESALNRVRRLSVVQFVEPTLYIRNLFSGSSSGCSNSSGSSGGQPYSEYDANPPRDSLRNDVLPWNFNNHRIPEAWARGASGKGVAIGIPDTGVYEQQSQLRSAFAPAGTNRWIFHDVTDGSLYPWDECGHGTRMVSTVAAPRDGRNIVGVAWGANVVSMKSVADPVLDGEDQSVAQAIYRMVDHFGARIIAMAFGSTWDYYHIKNVIEAQLSKPPDRRPLFIAAAGNTWCGPNPFEPRRGVVFPARMEGVLAVTSVLNGDVHPEACYGSEVDLAAVVGHVPAAGRYPDDLIEFGGTSDATAIVAGSAALVWSAHPTPLTADQVRDRLVRSACCRDYYQRWGAGVINTYKAVGGFTSLSIAGPSSVSARQPYKLFARPEGDGPFAYLWSNGWTGSELNMTAGAAGTSQSVWLRVTDTSENKSMTAYKTVRTESPPPNECVPEPGYYCP